MYDIPSACYYAFVAHKPNQRHFFFLLFHFCRSYAQSTTFLLPATSLLSFISPINDISSSCYFTFVVHKPNQRHFFFLLFHFCRSYAQSTTFLLPATSLLSFISPINDISSSCYFTFVVHKAMKTTPCLLLYSHLSSSTISPVRLT